MARKEHDIDIEIGAEIDGVKLAFQEIRRQAAELRTQLKPTADAMKEGFEKMGRETLPHVAAKAELAAEKLRLQAKKIADEIDGMDEEVEVDADVGPAKKAINDLREHIKKLNGHIKPTTDALRSDFVRLGNVINTVRGPVTTLGKLMAGVSFAGAAAGAWALHEAISSMREMTMETSTEITRLQNALPIYGLTDEKDTAEAIRQARAIEALFESFGMDESDARGIMPVLAMEAKNAAMGAEDALEKIGLFKMRYTDLFDDKGRLKDGVEQLVAWADAVARLDEDTAKTALMGLLGDDDGVRALQILRMGGKELRKRIEDNKAANILRNEDVEAAKAVRAAASAEGQAWENLGVSIARGFSPHLQQAIRDRTTLMGTLGDEATLAGEIGGELYSSVTESVTNAAAEILQILTTVEDGTTPLETTFERIADLIETILQGVVDLVRYFATGETEAPWLLGLLQKLEELKAFARSAYIEITNFKEGVERVWEVLTGFLETMGIDETWEQVGVIAGLIVFRGAISSVLGVIGTLALKIGELAGKTTALGNAAKGAAGAAATGAAGAAVKGAARAAGPVVAAVEAAKFSVDDSDLVHYTEKAFIRAQQIAKEQGDAAGWGYLKAMMDALEDRHGEGLFAGRLSRWFDENLGTDVFWDKDSYELGVALTVNEENAKEAARGAMMAFREAGGWEVGDDDRIEIGAGFTISGAELKAGVIEGVQAQLDAAPLTMTLKQIDLLGALENYQIELPEIKAPAAAEGGPANATPLQPLHLYVDGKSVGGIQVPPDQVETVRRALETARRAKS